MDNKQRAHRVLLPLILAMMTCQSVAVGAADGLTRTISVSAASFIRDNGSADILMDNDNALRWVANSGDEAGFYMSRPADWDGQTPVKVHIYFALGGIAAGSVNWRLKVNHYTPGNGEWLTNPADRNADAVLAFLSGPSWYRVYSQTFTLEASAFNSEPLWSMFFLRGNAENGEKFGGDLYVMSAGIEYGVSEPQRKAVVIPLSE